MQHDDINAPVQPADLPFAGARILEIGPGQGVAFAGKLLADFGAEVIKVEPPEGDELRQWSPLLDSGNSYESAWFAWLNTHKKSVTASHAEHAWLMQLAATADIVLDARALGDEGLAAWQHALVAPDAPHAPITAQLTWFGDSGPYCHYTGSDAVARAMSGAVHGNGPVQGPPHLPHDAQAGIVTGLATFGVVAASWLGRAQGSRRHVLSIHEILLHTVEMEFGIAQNVGTGPRLGINRYGATQPGGIFATQDGWIGVFTVTLAQWQGLCRAVGRADMADDARFTTGQGRMQHADAIDAVLQDTFPTRSSDEWFQLLTAEKHPAVIVPTAGQLMAQAVHRERGAFTTVTMGKACFEAPLLPQRLGQAGPLRNGRAPLLGQDNAHYRSAAGLQRIPTHLHPAQPDSLPLQGIRIIDLTMGWAGPFATRKLADLGADIIKIESTTYPDWWRGTLQDDAWFRGQSYEGNHNYLLMNRGKRGITLDLTQAAGRDIFLQLLQHADAVIDNYSSQVLPKLGLGPHTLHQHNPRLVVLTMPAFGLGNAWSNTRAYGGTLEQASGLPLYTGAPDSPPAMTSYAYGDPVGGFHSSAALLLGLLAQRKDGKGRHINYSQVEGMLALAAPYLIAHTVTGQVPQRLGNRHARRAPQGIYRCLGADTWLLISIATSAQWQALCHTIGQPAWATHPDLQTLTGRQARHDDIDQAIAAWCCQHHASHAAQLLQTARVPAGQVPSITRVMHDPHLLARGFWRVVQRAHGAYLSTSSYFRENGQPAALRQPAPTLGEHTETVLGELLGLDAATLASLHSHGVIGKKARKKT